VLVRRRYLATRHSLLARPLSDSIESASVQASSFRAKMPMTSAASLRYGSRQVTCYSIRRARRGLRRDSARYAAGALRYPANTVCIFASNQLLTFAKLGLSAIDPPVVDRCRTSMRVLTLSGAEASA
jgi:hypothetical protein